MTKSGDHRSYEIVGELLCEARGEARLTQMKLAKKLRQTQGFISRCENGERGLNIIELRRYCRVLGITLPEFVNRFKRAMHRKK